MSERETDGTPGPGKRPVEAEPADPQEPQSPIWLSYPMVDGFVHDWLVAGPVETHVTIGKQFSRPNVKQQVIEHFYSPASGIERAPIEFGTVAPADDSGAEVAWRVCRCEDDHFVDLSGFYGTPTYLRSWAYCAIDSPVRQDVTGQLTLNGPADVWLNGAHVQRVADFHDQIPGHSTVALSLQAGRNTLLVRFEEVAARACSYVLALRLHPHAPDAQLRVALPTAIEPAERRQRLETIFQQAYLDRDVFMGEERIVVRWPEGVTVRDDITLRLTRKDGRIYSEYHTEGRPFSERSLGRAYQFSAGDYQIHLFPPPTDFYIHNIRVERKLGLHLLGNNAYSTERYGSYQQRRAEALTAAARRSGNVFSEIAKMELGQWQSVNLDVIHQTLDDINRRIDCSDFYLVGLLGMVGRYIDEPGFPQDLIEPLQACFLNFRYWIDEPGDDAMCFWTENHQILFHACEVLAGQLLPDETFSNANMTGRQHQEKGERMALSWLQKRAAGGFVEWDSNTYFEEDVLALAHLADLAENDDVRELATVVLDKLFFTLAVNSFKGVFGSTHGRSYASQLKGAVREATAGLTRMLWGKGIFNQHIRGTVGLACAVGYQLPPVIEALALDPAEEIWNRERHAGVLETWCDQVEGKWQVDKVTYKTPDYMLASAQDYRPGEPGRQQHIWQATLSPEAVVFVTHPPCISESNDHRPSCWHGNVILPRVAQWKDTLIAIHRLPKDDWMGFTHAYFPIYAFDDYALRGDWAFARVGDGYLALTASQGVELIQQGKNAFRELRSYGHDNVWLVQMGRTAQDGSFAEFQEKMMGAHIAYDEAAVRAETLRGQHIEFAWTGPLRIDGVEQAITGFPHYDNPYSQTELGAEKMDIQFQDLLVRLDFSLDSEPVV